MTDHKTALLGPGAPVIALDVGGTDVKRAYADASGVVHPLPTVPTPQSRRGEALVQLAAETCALAPQAVACSVVVPGIVNAAAGVVVRAANLGFEHVPLGHMLSERLPMPVSFGHDVATAGYAEFRLGAARRCPNAAIVTVGTGIAAGLIVGGRPFTGDGWAGEIGHMQLATDTQCTCGGVGCLESVASAAAIARRYSALSGRDVRGAKQVLDLATAGDQQAQRVWGDAVAALAQGLQILSAVLGVERVVIGGGLVEAGDALLAPVREELRRRTSITRMPEVVPAQLGARAGIIGSLLRAREACA